MEAQVKGRRKARAGAKDAKATTNRPMVQATSPPKPPRGKSAQIEQDRGGAQATRVGTQAASPPESHRGRSGTLSEVQATRVGTQAASPPESHRGRSGTLSE